MQFDVSERTIYRVKHGSQAYGTSTPASDLDIKGVCIPPREYDMGFAFAFEQEERLVSKGHPEDKVTYSLRKFMKLAIDSNPNIIEVLFVDDADVLKIDAFGSRLRVHRDEFLSKKARHTFSGYATAQMRRIETHRRWLLERDRYEGAKPSREQFDLLPYKDGDKAQIEMALAEVQKRLDEWNVDMRGMTDSEKIHLKQRLSELFEALNFDREALWAAAATAVFDSVNLVAALQRERQYLNSVSDWEKYQTWKRERNPARAALEAKHGMDTKHAAHCVRLMRMCREILEGKGVIVRRPDAHELLQIRNGSWSYERLKEETLAIDSECAALYKTSSLRHIPDMKAMNDLCVDLTSDYYDIYG